MKRAKVFVLILFFSCHLLGQKADSIIAKNIVFIEALGVGGYGSINYERIVPTKTQVNFGIRAGLSVMRIRDFNYKFNPDIVIPFAVNFIYGTKHRAEIGIGQSLTNMVQANAESGEAERNTSFHATASIGYRYQKQTGGLYIRVVYSPIYENYNRLRHWGGLSLGFAF